MAFLLIGVILLCLKVGDIGPPAQWAWWIILSPFGLAAAWWSFADSSGLTARRESDKVDARADKRRQKNMEAMGLSAEAQAAKLATAKARRRAGARPS
jgi:small Trp-rich protein